MKEIMFNGEMVKQIHEGNKNATRRIVKPQPVSKMFTGVCTESTMKNDKSVGCFHFGNYFGDSKEYVKPPYKVGDILYVREAAMIQSVIASNESVKMLFKNGELHSFKVSAEEYQRLLKYAEQNKFLSPYWLTKAEVILYLKVTGVRVERLQDITIEQCKKESAIEILLNKNHPLQSKISEFAEWIESANDWYVGPKDAFAALWNSTIKKSDLDQFSWDANPWVWVIEFERCEKEVE